MNTVLPGAIQVDAENALPAHHRARPEDRIARQCVPRRGRPDDVAAAMALRRVPHWPTTDHHHNGDPHP